MSPLAHQTRFFDHYSPPASNFGGRQRRTVWRLALFDLGQRGKELRCFGGNLERRRKPGRVCTRTGRSRFGLSSQGFDILAEDSTWSPEAGYGR